jgi:3-methyladenine DNA glycosylase AlkD
MNNIISKVREELKRNADEKTQSSFQRFFKEEMKFHGVRTAKVVKIAKDYFKKLKGSDKKTVFALCEELLKSGYCEEAWIAANWAYWLHKDFKPGDFKTFEHWISLYIDNWAECDTLCNHAVGAFLEQYPTCLGKLKIWARSKNRWMRRASAVSLIIPAKRGKFLQEIFSIANILLLDGDDMVQKGYGWMLKEASRKNQKSVFDYVMKNKKVMPRTALRYAIEKMPEDLRRQAMKK